MTKEQMETWVIWRVQTEALGYGRGQYIERPIEGGRRQERPTVLSEVARRYGVRQDQVKLDEIDR